MIICVALDDKNGMMFNKRRQSKDKVLREYLLSECNGATLWMNEYTAGQFEEGIPENVVVDNDFMDKAGEDDYCFIENTSVKEYSNKINKIICFKWNKVYPADVYFDIQLNDGWTLQSSIIFEGSSHKEITKEIWTHE